jgi:hypothetical protein
MTSMFLVLLRRPKSDPSESRDDPFWEFGSFGCTGCHAKLLHPRKHGELTGAQLAFVQPERDGFRLVHVTPPSGWNWLYGIMKPFGHRLICP